MPPSKLLTHEDCREAVCVCCGVKTDKKRITVGQEAMVRSYAKPEYDSSVKSYPAGLCSTCILKQCTDFWAPPLRHTQLY